ncbi:MAG: AIM24 family protein, partial [Thermoplasmata archaeon]|nr:AIM24 family protein [Thermoplasmata archaeon]
MNYVEQYQQWYCYTCQKYNQPVQAQSAHQQPESAPAAQEPQQQPAQQPAQHTQPAPVSAGAVPENETIHSPSFTALIFHLKQGESITTEKGAMMYMNRTIEIQTAGRKGGLVKGLMTSALGGESFFVNTYTA